jgi:hypothetical protein
MKDRNPFFTYFIRLLGGRSGWGPWRALTGVSEKRVPSLTGLASISHFTRHSRAGLSHAAATRLRLGGAYSIVVPRIWF